MLFHFKQICLNTKMRATAFAAFGALSSYGVGAHLEIFLEQVACWQWPCNWGIICGTRFLSTIISCLDLLWLLVGFWVKQQYMFIIYLFISLLFTLSSPFTMSYMQRVEFYGMASLLLPSWTFKQTNYLKMSYILLVDLRPLSLRLLHIIFV